MDELIFPKKEWRLTNEQEELCNLSKNLGSKRFSKRAFKYDSEASFPVENYKDLAEKGLLGICVPKKYGGFGADLKTYMLAAAEIGRYCGATALTFNMHVSSCLWTSFLIDDLKLDEEIKFEHERLRSEHYKRIIQDGKIYAQPFSEGGAAAAGFKAFGTNALKVPDGWVINGKKIFASLSGHADYYGVLCSAIRRKDECGSRKNTMYLAVPNNADGVSVEGDWDPLGMRGTVSRTLVFRDVFVSEKEQLMPAGVYPEAAARWPHMFMTLTPAYMGIAQAAFDFTIKYLRGEVEGMAPVKRRMYPTKQLAVAEMKVMLEQTKAIWFQAISEAGPDPSKESLMRAYVAQYTVMENSNKLTQLALRTCGGQAMLKTLPLERLYRDSRCGSLMLPWTAELCLDKLGTSTLYEEGESD